MTGCPVPDCGRTLNPWPPLCSQHWFRLPLAMQSAIRHLAPRGYLAIPSPEHIAALNAAVEWIARDDAERATRDERRQAITSRITGDRE
jgi:hypothetical protein